MKLGKIILGGVAVVVAAGSFSFKPRNYSGGNLFTKATFTCKQNTICHTDIAFGQRQCLNGVTAYTTSTCTMTHIWSGKTRSVF